MRLCANDVGLFELVRRGVWCVFNGGNAGDLVFAASCGDSEGGEAVAVAISERSAQASQSFTPCSNRRL